MDLDIKVPQVVFVRHSADSGNSIPSNLLVIRIGPTRLGVVGWRGARLCHKAFCFLYDALWEGHLDVVSAALEAAQLWLRKREGKKDVSLETLLLTTQIAVVAV